MKAVFTLLVTLLAVNLAHADPQGSIVLGSDNLLFKIIVGGTGQHVCSAESTFKRLPYLGRGQTQHEAEFLALSACSEGGEQDIFCKLTSCEQDAGNKGLTSFVFKVDEKDAKINIDFNGQSRQVCYAEAWGRHYIAKAATRTEAKALVKSACAIQEGLRKGSGEPDGFFCKVEDNCDTLAAPSAEDQINDVLGDMIDILMDLEE